MKEHKMFEGKVTVYGLQIKRLNVYGKEKMQYKLFFNKEDREKFLNRYCLNPVRNERRIIDIVSFSGNIEVEQ